MTGIIIRIVPSSDDRNFDGSFRRVVDWFSGVVRLRRVRILILLRLVCGRRVGSGGPPYDRRAGGFVVDGFWFGELGRDGGHGLTVTSCLRFLDLGIWMCWKWSNVGYAVSTPVRRKAF